MRTTRLIFLAAIGTMISGCADSTVPTGAVADASRRVVHAAAKLDGSAPFTFDATFDDSGRPSGSWREEIAAGISVDVTVSCLTIIGSDAWAAGTITASADPRFVGRSATIHLAGVGTAAESTSYTLIDGGLSCEPSPIPTPGRLAQ